MSIESTKNLPMKKAINLSLNVITLATKDTGLASDAMKLRKK